MGGVGGLIKAPHSEGGSGGGAGAGAAQMGQGMGRTAAHPRDGERAGGDSSHHYTDPRRARGEGEEECAPASTCMVGCCCMLHLAFPGRELGQVALRAGSGGGEKRNMGGLHPPQNLP